MGSEEDRRIRALRPPKPAVDPWRPLDVLIEEERLPDGDQVGSVTIFLAGAECPFTCAFCDLWRYTTDAPTPPGAIPAQLRHALDQVASELPARAHVKLYNASNFFDDRAVPAADHAELARLLEPFEQVVVECHPRLVRSRAAVFSQRLRGRLQVAMGLETVHPEALPRLNKKATLDDFDQAASALRQDSLGLRVFVLVPAPYVPAAESPDWTRRSVVHALEQGAEHVSLIPVRSGNGELERLERAGAFTPPTLSDLETALGHGLEAGAQAGGVVTLDVWELERFAPCAGCREQRIARLARANLSGRLEPSVRCGACGSEHASC